MFYSDMNNVCGYSIEPDFSRKKHKIDEVLKKSLKTINKSVNTIQYVYYTEPDSIMHEFGPYSKEAKDVLKQIDKKIEKYLISRKVILPDLQKISFSKFSELHGWGNCFDGTYLSIILNNH